MSNNDTPLFARSPWGKCDDEVKVRIPTELKLEAQTLAYSLGLDLSDFVRELIAIRVRGVEHAQRVAQARVLTVAGMTASSGNNGAPRGEQT